jgi:thiol-disulfide isomerase/thioredoxin
VEEDDCANYPDGPYGTALGDVLEQLAFEPATREGLPLAGVDGLLGTCDLYNASVDQGGELTGVLFWFTAGWCPYCGQEAAKLNALYESLKEQGILLVGVVTEDELQRPADVGYAAKYAHRYRWTFPAVPGQVGTQYWPADAVASGEIGVPLHLFVDARTMRLYARMSGAPGSVELLRPTLDNLVKGPVWGPDGVPQLDFDCNPESGNETEPNGAGPGETPEDGRVLPYRLEGTLCPPLIGDGGVALDTEMIDLGELTAGTALEVSLRQKAGTGLKPFVQLMRVAVTASGMGAEWQSQSPVATDASAGGRQWLLDTDGWYFLLVIDGRVESERLFGGNVPAEEECCQGGPDHGYELEVTELTLAPTDNNTLTRGSAVSALIDAGRLNVHALAVTPGESFTIRMNADDSTALDPYLLLYDPVRAEVLAFNDDDPSGSAGTNSAIQWEAPEATTEVWVVASLWGGWFREGPAGYQLVIE